MTHTHLLLVVCLLYVSCHDVKLVLLCHMTVAVAEGVALFFLIKTTGQGGGELFFWGEGGGRYSIFSCCSFYFCRLFQFFCQKYLFPVKSEIVVLPWCIRS